MDGKKIKVWVVLVGGCAGDGEQAGRIARLRSDTRVLWMKREKRGEKTMDCRWNCVAGIIKTLQLHKTERKKHVTSSIRRENHLTQKKKKTTKQEGIPYAAMDDDSVMESMMMT